MRVEWAHVCANRLPDYKTGLQKPCIDGAVVCKELHDTIWLCIVSIHYTIGSGVFVAHAAGREACRSRHHLASKLQSPGVRAKFNQSLIDRFLQILNQL